jgi:hypothetical protein
MSAIIPFPFNNLVSRRPCIAIHSPGRHRPPQRVAILARVKSMPRRTICATATPKCFKGVKLSGKSSDPDCSPSQDGGRKPGMVARSVSSMTRMEPCVTLPGPMPQEAPFPEGATPPTTQSIPSGDLIGVKLSHTRTGMGIEETRGQVRQRCALAFPFWASTFDRASAALCDPTLSHLGEIRGKAVTRAAAPNSI